MSDQLLSYFERELASLRGALSEFSREYPEHAASMRLNQNEQEDPNIRRFIEAAALLNAKTEKRLDEQFPEILQDLINIVYPGYLQIIPSYTPFSLELDLEAATSSIELKKGAELAVTHDDVESMFTFADDLNVEPFHIADISASTAPFNFPTPSTLRRSESAIQVRLKCNDPDISFSEMDIDHFDFYVRGFESSSRGLIDLLLLNTDAIALGSGEQQLSISPKRLRSRIADADFNWLPTYDGHLTGFDILRDYFAYSDKAAFMRIDGLGEELKQFDCNEVTLTLFVYQLPVEYLSLFDPSVLLLNTVPALNLFRRRGEPLRYDFTKLSIPVIADAQDHDLYTVVSVETVSEVLSTGEVPLTPIYESGYWSDSDAPQWQSSQHWDHKGRRCLSLSVSYPQLTNEQEAVVLSTQLLLCNGRNPCLIPTSSEAESMASVALPGKFKVIKTPTAPLYPALDNQLTWRFLAILNANFATLVQTDEPTLALQDVLRLSCNAIQCPQAYAIKTVSYRHLVAPITISGQSIFASGTEIEVIIDDEVLGVDFAVFAQVLNAVFTQYCSFDRFVQLSVQRFGSDSPGIEFEKVHGSQLCI
ncbi:type VI secretion system baseplate subunit TssF [Vibrio fluminensis]|uniref:type VI secretion system baseplate subunit TssF n=1 Tax=Vibrio fluminensis TaxID=2783614 RepID=UPI001886BEF2|nr:type VI secretion system baseplate subunit TssF [Vibrio fluminensis]